MWGPNSVAESTVREWLNNFRSGDFSLGGEPRSGRPKAIPDWNSKAFVDSDLSQTLRGGAEKPDVDKSTVAGGFKPIGKVKKPENWVPHNVSDRQELARPEVPSSLLLRHRNNPVFG